MNHPKIPHTSWSPENLSKLAWLEKKAIDYLDNFIDRQISKGDTSVALKRFPGEISHAHEYNLRDYIGRSEGLIFDFLSDRPYLWSVSPNGFVTKCTEREYLREMAILMEKRGRRGQGTKLGELVELMSQRHGSIHSQIIKSLLQYPEVFKAIDIPDDDAEFEFLLTIIDGVILPKSITSEIGNGVVKALAVTPVPGSIDSGNIGSEYVDDQMESVGHVVYVDTKFGFLTYQKNGRGIRVFFDSRALGLQSSTPLSAHVKVGDQVAFKAVINQIGLHAGKLCAVFVRNQSLISATKPHSDEGGIRKLQKPMDGSDSHLNLEVLAKNSRHSSHGDQAHISDQASICQQSNNNGIHTGDHQLAIKIDRVDVGVQTDVTDDQILLRLLRSFPHLLDGYRIVLRQ